MRPTTATMLQQNNNNNYPCLNISASTREILQKCSKASLPLPSRLELGLGDLPLIRGLRAWALCSKNRRKSGGPLGGGQAPTAPPAGHRDSTSCLRPADVYLSGEWGRMGYRHPLGLNGGQAGIGALVTVATLKTSEGTGKTQTQCLFLQTEKGSCLYPTTKPDSGVISSTSSSVVGGWLRGKTGGGGRNTPGGRRDHGLTSPAQTGANRVRVRSGRRWRKSCNAAGWEKTGVSRERQQSSREDHAGGIILEEWQEEQDKGGPGSKQCPSGQPDIGRVRHEKEGASPRSCHNASPRTSIQTERGAQRRESYEGGESPGGGVPNRLNSELKGMRKERQRNEEEEKGCHRLLESSNSVLTVLNRDLEYNSFQPESQSSHDIRGAENEDMKTQTSHDKNISLEREEDAKLGVMEIHPNNDSIHGQPEQVMDVCSTRQNRNFDDRKPSKNPCERTAANVEGFSDCIEKHQDSERDMKSVGGVDGCIINTTKFSSVSECCEGVSVSTCPVQVSTAVFPLPSLPVDGSTWNADHEISIVLGEQASNTEYHLKGHQVADSGIVGKEELNCVSDVNNTVNNNGKLLFLKNVEKTSQEEKDGSPSPLNDTDHTVLDDDGRITTENECSTTELYGTEKRDELQTGNGIEESKEENIEQRINYEEGGEALVLLGREYACMELEVGDGKGDENDSTTWEDVSKDIVQSSALKDAWMETIYECVGRRKDPGGTSEHTSITHVSANGESSSNFIYFCFADPSTAPGLPVAHPAPSLPPLGSMAASLPCSEEKEEGVTVTTGDKEEGRERKGRNRRELEDQGEEERGCTVASEENEDEFGVFIQAEGEPSWSEGSTMSASVPYGSRASVAHGHNAISRESTHWTPGWTGSSFHQPDDAWTAFPQDSSDDHRDVVGQWWPTSSVEEGKDRILANQNLVAVVVEAFPSLPPVSSSDPCDLDSVPTLTQLLKGKASQDQGLLDSFHDLNKMICQRYKRANSVSCDLLLKTLHLVQPQSASGAASLLSPGLPSANHHAQNAGVKRRLSYDCNRNVIE
ncbi:uncharacterized protein si:ch211-14c7.2 [Antennarius striatus]|uniref:uncharacterized protein si:ch211-14c7.2 n=1 Tax=Antennarius striatus TaxID=241820 RepID=UPI0035B34FC9